MSDDANKGKRDADEALINTLLGQMLRSVARKKDGPRPGMVEADIRRHGPGRVEIPEDAQPYYEDMKAAGCYLDANETSEDVFDLCIMSDGVRISEVKKNVPRGMEIATAFGEPLRAEPWIRGKDDARG